jgi:hypothetical protein
MTLKSCITGLAMVSTVAVIGVAFAKQPTANPRLDDWVDHGDWLSPEGEGPPSRSRPLGFF